MNRQLSFIALAIVLGLTFSCNDPYKDFKNNETDYAIIPAPAWEQQLPGRFPLDDKAVIVAGDGLQKEAEYLRDLIADEFGVDLTVAASAGFFESEIELRIEEGEGNAESYELVVIPDKVLIKAPEAKGVFLGIQSLRQLVNFSDKEKGLEVATITGVHIKDTPRFPYRGMHLDVARHFQPVSFVKRFIDMLALHKMNTFHWHLTEDQGWRIAIKKYPKLTGVGAWRNGTVVGKMPWTENDNTRYGGSYTQEEIKEIVQYASDRHITVIPEIEMPGHSAAAIAAYPELSCFPEKPTQLKRGVLSAASEAAQKEGQVKLVYEEWGVTDDVYCAGKEETFTFLTGVLDEVIDLFPSEYIHIGGDECPKTHWEACERCQLRMQEEGLADEHELQSYFIKRIENYLNAKGRKIIGWDEILEGGLAPNATVMYWRAWRGDQEIIEAANNGHHLVMTPSSHMYFDHYQADEATEPEAICCLSTVEKVYHYEPVPEGLKGNAANNVLGAQANVWTEYMKTSDHVEYMVLPRLAALSEVVWSDPEKKNYEEFLNRLQALAKHYDQKGYTYATHVFTDSTIVR